MLTNNYKPFLGGVPISVERQAKELTKLGHDVTVFAPEYGDRGRECEGTNAAGKMKCEGTNVGKMKCEGMDCEENIRIIRFGTQNTRMENGMVYPKMILPEITTVFQKESFDLIHVHHPMFVGPAALYLGRKYGIPVIYTYHTRYEDYLHYIRLLRERKYFPNISRSVLELGKNVVVPGYMKWFTNQCDMVLAPTAGMMQRIRENGTNVPMAVFPTGLEDEFYLQYPKAAEQIRRKYIPEGRYLFCTTGRLEEEKNPWFLLRGIRELKEQMRERLKAPFRVLLLGDGSIRMELEEEAHRLGISECVSFVGNIDNRELNRYLQACDVFLFASKSETQGIVLAEALASGCPVVAVKASGVEDIVKDGINGFQTEEDAKVWAEKVIEVIGNGRRMKEKACQTAEAYRASRLAIYEELLYGQCITAKQREYEEVQYENDAADWKERASDTFSGLFKTS